MRILSPEKKCLYYLMVSQLHEDGYTQQAMQLEVSTLYSTNNVKASDKLSRLFSSCMGAVNEASNYFSNRTPHIAGRKRLGTHSAANIRAASIANLAKRRRTAATVDSTNMLQDSIKKCVKLVTTDLQKATADIGKSQPKPNVLVSPKSSSNLPSTSRLTSPSHINKTKHAQRQRASVDNYSKQSTSPVASKSNNIANVSNSFLRGITLFKSTAVPKVSPYTAPTSKANAVSSDTAPVIRVTKNISNEPVLIDVENTPVSTHGTSSLQLTSPVSIPMSLASNTLSKTIPMSLPSSNSPASSIPSPGLLSVNPPIRSKVHQNPNLMLTSPRAKNFSVGTKHSAALKSLVSKISKKPVLSVPKMNMPRNQRPMTNSKESAIEVVVVDVPDHASPPKNSPRVRPSSSEQQPTAFSKPPYNKRVSNKDTSNQNTENQNVSNTHSPNVSSQDQEGNYTQEDSSKEKPANNANQKSPENPAEQTVPKQEERDYTKEPAYCDHTIAKQEVSEEEQPSQQQIPENPDPPNSENSSGSVLSALGLQPSKQPAQRSSTTHPSSHSRSETPPQYNPASVSHSTSNSPINYTNNRPPKDSVPHKLQVIVGCPPDRQAGRPPPPSEHDFPTQIFADEMVNKDSPSSKSSDTVLSPTSISSISDALHAATDALLEQ